jgi:hypothetical protein
MYDIQSGITNKDALRVWYLLKISALVNIIKKILTLLSLIVQEKTLLSLKEKTHNL